MHRFRSRLLVAATLCLLLASPLQAVKKKTLESRISAILAEPDMARGFWGIEIRSLTTGKILFSQDADKLFTPASNTKLFTTAASLALIGPDYKFRTTVETNGLLDKHGRLSGDLLLVGRGDPNLSGRELVSETEEPAIRAGVSAEPFRSQKVDRHETADE